MHSNDLYPSLQEQAQQKALQDAVSHGLKLEKLERDRQRAELAQWERVNRPPTRAKR